MKNLFYFFIGLILSIIFLIPSSIFGATLKDSYNTGDTTANSWNGTYWEYQSFLAGSSYTLNSVKLKIYRLTGENPGTITVHIRDEDGAGKPTGADLTSGTVVGTTIPEGSPGDWVEFIMSEGISIVEGNSYTIIISADGANQVYVRENRANGYANGNEGYSANSGSTWTIYGDDRDSLFETYEGSTPPAEPEGIDYEFILAMLMLGIFLLIFIDFIRRLLMGI